MLFLSYAGEDGETAEAIGEWFRSRQIETYLWQDPQRRGRRFIADIESAMNKADLFLALMSPSFIASPWCHRESEMAIQREEDMQARDRALSFIRVLEVLKTPYREAGFLSTYDWLELTSPQKREEALRDIARSAQSHGRMGSQSIAISGRADSASAGEATPRPGSPTFRNRDDEVDRVLRGLTNAAGPHFWLVVAPPQLGKTWFMDHVAAKLLEESDGWAARRVDLREHPAEMRDDAASLLMHLFGQNQPVNNEPSTFRRIAQGILQGRKPYLCLLDSAELLKEETASILRSCLSEIYRLVEMPRIKGVRFAFIVASRRDDEWRGVTPNPRLATLSLTEFKKDVVQESLRDLAHEMGASRERSESATLVHRLSEGLPALLVHCLRWIQVEQWIGMERLESQELFEELAHPYIREVLLSQNSLFISIREQDAEPRRALEHAFRVLAPYRLFTMSHLWHHFESDRGFKRAIEDVGWSIPEIWNAMSDTALLSRPLDEPWQETQAAIRRLLFRYFYDSDERRAEAHRSARRFAEIWSVGQSGNEQVIGLVESLWHEAAALRLSRSADMAEVLSESAGTLSDSLRPSPLYTVPELRKSAAKRMRSDEEFQDTVEYVPGLFATLVRIVAPTEEL